MKKVSCVLFGMFFCLVMFCGFGVSSENNLVVENEVQSKINKRPFEGPFNPTELSKWNLLNKTMGSDGLFYVIFVNPDEESEIVKVYTRFFVTDREEGILTLSEYIYFFKGEIYRIKLQPSGLYKQIMPKL